MLNVALWMEDFKILDSSFEITSGGKSDAIWSELQASLGYFAQNLQLPSERTVSIRFHCIYVGFLQGFVTSNHILKTFPITSLSPPTTVPKLVQKHAHPPKVSPNPSQNLPKISPKCKNTHFRGILQGLGSSGRLLGIISSYPGTSLTPWHRVVAEKTPARHVCCPSAVVRPVFKANHNFDDATSHRYTVKHNLQFWLLFLRFAIFTSNHPMTLWHRIVTSWLTMWHRDRAWYWTKTCLNWTGSTQNTCSRKNPPRTLKTTKATKSIGTYAALHKTFQNIQAIYRTLHGNYSKILGVC